MANALVAELDHTLLFDFSHKAFTYVSVFGRNNLVEPLIKLNELAQTKDQMGQADLLDIDHKYFGYAPSVELAFPFPKQHYTAHKISNEIVQGVNCMDSVIPRRAGHDIPA